MKNLVILTDNFLPKKDGISRFLSEIIPRIKDSYNVHVVCPNYGPINEFKTIQITTIPLSRREFGDFTLAKIKPGILFSAIKKADIVFSQTIGPVGGLGLFIAHILRKKTISYVHSVEWELFSKATTNKTIKKYAPIWTKRLVRFLYSGCKKLIVPSERISEMLTWQGINKLKTVIHLGVDTNKFKKRDATSLREELGFKKSDIVIGYHGRIAREKDIPTLLRAHIKIRKNHPEVKLLLVGDGLSKLISRIKKQPGVVYVPAVVNVEYYLNAMDIFCLSSLTETTSLSTLEAMSSELPVLTTPVGFISDYVKDGRNGYFFKIGDSFDLMNKITKLLSKPELFKKMGARGRSLVLKNFDWDVTAEKLVHFLQKEK